ncbi:MAG: glycosyltransferase family 39 protein [Candidatus Thorarchaeota archaeon]
MSSISEDAPLPEKKKIDWIDIRFIKRYKEDVMLLSFAALVTILSCIYYLSTMLTISDPGLTLDDSWIHVQFARTIFEGNAWEYSPGYPSTGSTSPLWSVILSSIFFFTSDQFGIVWGTYIISIGFFTGSTYLGGRLVANYLDDPVWGYLTMVVFVVIPRNAWLMLSGMETPLFVFILLLSIWMLDNEEMKYDLLLGVVAGLAYLSRPEGALIVLLIPIRLFMLGVRRKITKQRIGLFILSGVLAIIVVSPWILHCLSTTGYPLPDTFYSKVKTPTEFEIGAWDRWWVVFVNQIPYIPAAVFLGVVLIVKGKPFAWLVPVILTVSYRLSTPYIALINNARYLVPIFDLFIIVAIASGTIVIRLAFISLLEVKDQVTINLAVVVLLLFVVLTPMVPHYVWQATNYGKAAGNINDMQVHLGYWLDENTPADSVFATHDAGALRFFSGRTMIDLAGLVSPDLNHRNLTSREKVQYLYEHGCNYFVFFDEIFVYWTQFFPSNAYSKIYTVFLPDNVVCGRDTMSVFQIFWEQTDYPANSA